MRLHDSIEPEWAGCSALPKVGCLMSTRLGGVSPPPWDSLNLGLAVGDDLGRVARNRERFGQATGVAPVYLKQVHGVRVLRLHAQDAAQGAPLQEADASVTTEPGVACTVQVADCLPVLFAAPEGLGVAAAHAGWRGLGGGVLEATLSALCEATQCAVGDVRVWLGPCIGPRQFEVGAQVREAFEADQVAAIASCFQALTQDKWLADLQGLARVRLRQAGVCHLSAVQACTVEQASRFFSFRREGVTGRMAAAIWIRH